MNEQVVKAKRGLILGGGGVVGLAWEIGILHGLASAGVTFTDADEVIGTSAGAFAGAALFDSRGLGWAFDRQMTEAVDEISADFPPEVIEALTSILQTYWHDPEEAGRRLGIFSLDAKTVDTEARMAVVRDRLGTDQWPSDRLRFTAIDADSGKLHLLDSKSGLDIASAAAASGAAPGIWPVVEAAGRQWIDGGSVSSANEHFAENFDACLVISPMTLDLLVTPMKSRLEALSKTNSLLISPDEKSAAAIGANPFDASRRPAAAQAGYEQGRAMAAEVARRFPGPLPQHPSA